MDELFDQTRKIFMNESLADHQKVFDKQIAFNVIPQVEEFIGEETKCEWRIQCRDQEGFGMRDVREVRANCASSTCSLSATRRVCKCGSVRRKPMLTTCSRK